MVRWEDKQMQEQTLIPRRRSKEETSLTLCVCVSFRLLKTRLEVGNASGQRHCVNAIMYLLTTAVLFFFVPSDAEKDTFVLFGLLLYQEAASRVLTLKSFLEQSPSLLNCNKEEHSTDKKL
jgi:hypothetical protein